MTFPLSPPGTPAALSPLKGWAGAVASRAHLVEATDALSVARMITDRPARGVLARGGGCSYGDAALNAGGFVLRRAGGSQVRLDLPAMTLRAGGGATFTDLLRTCVPQGVCPAVLPGTRHLTVGGAVAADVHGKNHRRDGSTASWVDSVELVTGDGRVRTVSCEEDRDLFRATVGGMGLTGVLTEATMRVVPLRSTRVDVVSTREDDLDAMLSRLEGASTRYAVGWVDGTARGRGLGRGVVDLGEIADADDLPQAYRPGHPPTVPAVPVGIVGYPAARAFNSAWFHAARRHRHTSVSFSAFFHRLDALTGWNRGLGPYGFLQYQFVVPPQASRVLEYALGRVTSAHAPCFLGTVKRFGPGNDHPLSFPMEGWSLALDIALSPRTPQLAPLLDDLDQVVAEAGGRVYLAKDSRLRRDCFTTMYPQVDAWLQTRERVDPDGVMRSDLGRRLGLCG